MFNWENSTDHISWNEVFSSIRKNAKMHEAFESEHASNEEKARKKLSTIMHHTMFGFFYGLGINLWQVWVFLVVLGVTIYVLCLCCCGAARKMIQTLQNHDG